MWYRWGGEGGGWDRRIGESVKESLAASKKIKDLGERVLNWRWVGVGVFYVLWGSIVRGTWREK